MPHIALYPHTLDAAIEQATNLLLEETSGRPRQLAGLVTAIQHLRQEDPAHPELIGLYLDLQNAIHRHPDPAPDPGDI